MHTPIELGRKLIETGQYSRLSKTFHRNNWHEEGAALLIEARRADAAMFLLMKKIKNTRGREAKKQLHIRYGKLLNDAGYPGCGATFLEAAREYAQAGHAAMKYGRPDWTVEMYHKAKIYDEGIARLTAKEWHAWASELSRQGKPKNEERAAALEGQAAEHDLAMRDAWYTKDHLTLARIADERGMNALATMYYFKAGQPEKGARCALKEDKPEWVTLILHDSPIKAGELLSEGKEHDLSAEMFEKAGDYERAAAEAEKANKPLWAKRLRQKMTSQA